MTVFKKPGIGHILIGRILFTFPHLYFRCKYFNVILFLPDITCSYVLLIFLKTTCEFFTLF
jgi:hypothetical protein